MRKILKRLFFMIGIFVLMGAVQFPSYADTTSILEDPSTVVEESETVVEPTVTVPVLLETPQLKISCLTDSGKPKLSWNEVKGADAYVVYRAFCSDGNYEPRATVTELTWTHSGAVAGKRYFYKIQAISSDEPEKNSVLSQAKARVCDLKRPVCKVDLNKKGKPVVSWKAVKNSETYEIYRALKKNGIYKKIATVRGTRYTHQKAYYHKTYYYKVKAIDAELPTAASSKSKPCEIYTIDLRKKLVALTFDDGPGPYTKRIVNCLKKHNGRATFYVLGQRVKAYPSQIKAIYKGGNEIGNHSYSHPMLYNLSAKQIRSQMNRTDNAIKKLTGTKPVTMRPPGGGVDSLVRKNVRKPMILWSIDTRDWEHRNKNMTVNHVLNNVSDGDIVLMHDIHEPTMRAALELIPKLKKKGYELVTVSELAKYRGMELKNGKSYYCF